MLTSSKTAKKISDAPQQSLTPKPNSFNKPSISQKKKKTKATKHLTINSRTLTLALKFYPEQLLTATARASITNPNTGRIDYSLWKSGDLLDLSKKYLRSKIKSFSTSFNSLKSSKDTKKRHWEILAICHDRDEVANPDDLFQPSILKPHFHVILRDANGNRFHVLTALKALGLNYSKEDSKLFYEHGATTVSNFNAYAMYLTHETDQAIKDGKERYSLDEILTNVSKDELKAIRAGYVRLQSSNKLTDSDWNKLADVSAKLGDEMKDFQTWADKSLTFSQQANAKFLKLQQVYNRHLLSAVEKSPDLIRCCVLISGKANDGKSYTTRHALENLGEVVYNARQGSGKYDGLTYLATAMIFDDRKMTDSLNVTDNRATVLHSRGTGNDKPWLGKYVIITTNLDPNTFFSQQVLDESQVEALRSRFYVTTLKWQDGRGKLVLQDGSSRGNVKDIKVRNELYKKFATEFNKLILNYRPLEDFEIPKLDAQYYDSTPNSVHSLSPMAYKIRDLIQVTGLKNLIYTGDIISSESPNFDNFVSKLKKFPVKSLVYMESETQSSCTVEELLKKLNTRNPFLSVYDADYIRIED